MENKTVKAKRQVIEEEYRSEKKKIAHLFQGLKQLKSEFNQMLEEVMEVSRHHLLQHHGQATEVLPLLEKSYQRYSQDIQENYQESLRKLYYKEDCIEQTYRQKLRQLQDENQSNNRKVEL